MKAFTVVQKGWRVLISRVIGWGIMLGESLLILGALITIVFHPEQLQTGAPELLASIVLTLLAMAIPTIIGWVNVWFYPDLEVDTDGLYTQVHLFGLVVARHRYKWESVTGWRVNPLPFLLPQKFITIRERDSNPLNFLSGITVLQPAIAVSHKSTNIDLLQTEITRRVEARAKTQLAHR